MLIMDAWKKNVFFNFRFNSDSLFKIVYFLEVKAYYLQEKSHGALW